MSDDKSGHDVMMDPNHLQNLQLQQVNYQAHMEQLDKFWQAQMEEIEKMDTEDFKNHQLPLARIKKIMKSDEDVRMISAEAPVLFAKACEMFILELTHRSWIHTEENKRRTLQRNDIAMAITKTDIFDFLIDIVPRDELGKPPKKEDMPRPPMMHDQMQYFYLQQAQMGGHPGADPMMMYQQAPHSGMMHWQQPPNVASGQPPTTEESQPRYQ
eukprot:GILJ01001548.1.p1 GENE.GILJ01001548.1~~GILJ01001548.1.p1  ORF type:complete len:232 (-),score=37.39 GILJ01001548.1:151-789(-)